MYLLIKLVNKGFLRLDSDMNTCKPIHPCPPKGCLRVTKDVCGLRRTAAATACGGRGGGCPTATTTTCRWMPRCPPRRPGSPSGPSADRDPTTHAHPLRRCLALGTYLIAGDQMTGQVV